MINTYKVQIRGAEISDLSTCPWASQNGNFTCPKKNHLPRLFLLNWYYALHVDLLS